VVQYEYLLKVVIPKRGVSREESAVLQAKSRFLADEAGSE
jgi:hypothetical protein